jgi:hypothetical protein
VRKRSTTVVLGALATLVAATLVSGCQDNEDPDYAQVCLDERTRKRIEDERCDDSTTGGTRWFYVPRGTVVPPVGDDVDTSRGSFTRPSSGSVHTVSRGGFGGRSGTGGGS